MFTLGMTMLALAAPVPDAAPCIYLAQRACLRFPEVTERTLRPRRPGEQPGGHVDPIAPPGPPPQLASGA